LEWFCKFDQFGNRHKQYYEDKILFKQSTKLLAFLFIILSSIVMSNAQENKPSIKYNLFSVDGLVISDIINIDAKFAQEHNIPILTPFTIKVPRQKDVTSLFEYGTAPNSMIIKINFATGGKNLPNEERELIENLQFIPFDIEMTDDEDRLKRLTNLMPIDAFNMATQAYEQKEFIGARRTVINGIDVIDGVGKYTHPQLGLVYVRITGFLNKDDVNGVFAMSNLVANKYDITNLEQIFLTNAGKTIESFEYLK